MRSRLSPMGAVSICFEEVVERSASTIMARSGGKC